METEYCGIKIRYDESQDLWVTDSEELDRSASTLTELKGKIDAFLTRPKEKRTFNKRQILKVHWKEKPEIVTVTGTGEGRIWSSENMFWINDGNRRIKEYGSNLREYDETLLKAVNEKLDQIEVLQKEVEEIQNKKMKRLAEDVQKT